MLWAAFALVAAAQENMPPKPGPEYQALGFFAGTWRFEGEQKEGPMGPAGKITSTDTCEWLEGGFALLCRSEGMNPMGPTSAIAISSYDMAQKAYTYYGVEAGMPPFMATGQRDGKVWRYRTESQMGDTTVWTRVTIAETSATSYSFEVESSTDGKTWTRVVEGTATKRGS
jgi:hypothetical protein